MTGDKRDGGEGGKNRGMSSAVIGEFQHSCFNRVPRKHLTVRKNVEHVNTYTTFCCVKLRLNDHWLDVIEIIKILQELACKNRFLSLK